MKTLFRVIWIVLLDNRGEAQIPDEVIRDLARFFLPNIIAFYQSEEGKAEFAKWKAEQEAANNSSEKKKKSGEKSPL